MILLLTQRLWFSKMVYSVNIAFCENRSPIHRCALPVTIDWFRPCSPGYDLLFSFLIILIIYKRIRGFLAGLLAGFLADKVSGQTTGAIVMPFCIGTTYWSPTWLGVFFSKISKYGNPAHTYAYFAFYTITQKLLNQIWPDFTYSFLDGFLNFL